MKSVGEYPTPETSVNSVGEYPTTETSVNSVNSVGGLAEGGVGMAGCHTLLQEKSVGEYPQQKHPKCLFPPVSSVIKTCFVTHLLFRVLQKSFRKSV